MKPERGTCILSVGCPACGLSGTYVYALDLVFHENGTDNRRCHYEMVTDPPALNVRRKALDLLVARFR